MIKWSNSPPNQLRLQKIHRLSLENIKLNFKLEFQNEIITNLIKILFKLGAEKTNSSNNVKTPSTQAFFR